MIRCFEFVTSEEKITHYIDFFSLEVLIKLYDIPFHLINTYFFFWLKHFAGGFRRKIKNKITPCFQQKICNESDQQKSHLICRARSLSEVLVKKNGLLHQEKKFPTKCSSQQKQRSEEKNTDLKKTTKTMK